MRTSKPNPDYLLFGILTYAATVIGLAVAINPIFMFALIFVPALLILMAFTYTK